MSLKSYLAAQRKKKFRFAVLRPPVEKSAAVLAWAATRGYAPGQPWTPEDTDEFNRRMNAATEEFTFVGFITGRGDGKNPPIYDQHGYRIPGASLQTGDVFDEADVFLNRIESGFYQFQPKAT